MLTTGFSLGYANTDLWPLYGQCSTNLSLASLWAMPTPISGLSMGNANTDLWPLYGQCQHLSLASLWAMPIPLSPLWTIPTPISHLSIGNANTYLSFLYGQCQHLSLASKLQSRHSIQALTLDSVLHIKSLSIKCRQCFCT